MTKIEGGFGVVCVMPGINHQDFAYQVVVNMTNEDHIKAGIAFHVDESSKECYVFLAERYSPLDVRMRKFFYDFHNLGSPKERETNSRREVEDLFKVPAGEWRKPMLLAIVSQGIVLDFYINLMHCKRLYTTFASSGSIGLYSHRGKPNDFRYTKLWVK